MMKLEDVGLVFHQEYLRTALMLSLLSVWVLVGFLFRLNHYIRRDYFSIWTGAWLSYALWLTLSVCLGNAEMGGIAFAVKQCLLSFSAVLLLWGCLRFLGLPVEPRLLAGFMLFVAVGIFVGTQVVMMALLVELPVFILLGLGSPFAGLCYLRLRRQKARAGEGVLALGILLWGICLGSHPFFHRDQNLYNAGIFGAAAVQFLFAVGMMTLVLEEIRARREQMQAERAAVLLKGEDSQIKVITAREESPRFDGAPLTEGTQRAYNELRRTQQAMVQQERLLALGQMVNGVAHDINNALSPITAYSELLLSSLPDLADAPPQRLKQISQAADDVAQIVARMREFYRRDLNPEPPAKGNDLTTAHWRDLGGQRQGTSIHTKFERLLLECSGDFSFAQSSMAGPVRWLSSKK